MSRPAQAPFLVLATLAMMAGAAAQIEPARALAAKPAARTSPGKRVALGESDDGNGHALSDDATADAAVSHAKA